MTDVKKIVLDAIAALGAVPLDATHMAALASGGDDEDTNPLCRCGSSCVPDSDMCDVCNGGVRS